MVLSVKPSNSIEMIKTQIESLNNIPVKDQILTLNGEKLKNEDKLSRFQIENCIIRFLCSDWAFDRCMFIVYINVKI